MRSVGATSRRLLCVSYVKLNTLWKCFTPSAVGEKAQWRSSGGRGSRFTIKAPFSSKVGADPFLHTTESNLLRKKRRLRASVMQWVEEESVRRSSECHVFHFCLFVFVQTVVRSLQRAFPVLPPWPHLGCQFVQHPLSEDSHCDNRVRRDETVCWDGCSIFQMSPGQSCVSRSRLQTCTPSVLQNINIYILKKNKHLLSFYLMVFKSLVVSVELFRNQSRTVLDFFKQIKI